PSRRCPLRHQPNCTKPQIASRAETTRATHDTFIDIWCGPITTGHRLSSHQCHYSEDQRRNCCISVRHIISPPSELSQHYTWPRLEAGDAQSDGDNRVELLAALKNSTTLASS